MSSAMAGQGGDLWDDHLLIGAFNDGISKYKKMHKMKQNVGSDDAQKAVSFKEDISDPVYNADDVERNEEIKDDYATASNTKSERDDNATISTVKETFGLELEAPEAPENHLNPSTGQYFQYEPTAHPNSQSPKDYNQLLNEYHELEGRRQEILQQLNEYSYGTDAYNYDTGTYEQCHTYAPQGYWVPTSCICPYGCQSWITQCSQRCCYSNKASTSESSNAPAEAACSKDSVPLNDNNIVKTANATAERAFSFMKEQMFANEGKERPSEMHANDSAENTSSGTDLTMVLNAWYSAGFFTGKYLTEQSGEKK